MPLNFRLISSHYFTQKHLQGRGISFASLTPRTTSTSRLLFNTNTAITCRIQIPLDLMLRKGNLAVEGYGSSLELLRATL